MAVPVKYMVVEGSEMGHCCVEYTIIDTSVPMEDFPVCECFDATTAHKIAKALNEAEGYDYGCN